MQWDLLWAETHPPAKVPDLSCWQTNQPAPDTAEDLTSLAEVKNV